MEASQKTVMRVLGCSLRSARRKPVRVDHQVGYISPASELPATRKPLAHNQHKLSSQIYNAANKTKTQLLLLNMLIMTPLDPNLLRPPLQILRQVRSIRPLIRPRNNPRCVLKQVIHLLERQQLGLGQREPKVHGIGEVEDNKDHVELPANVGDGGRSHLADHGVKGERHHGGDGDTLGARVRVKDLGGDDEGERAAGGGEGDVVKPGANLMRNLLAKGMDVLGLLLLGQPPPFFFFYLPDDEAPPC